MALKQKHMRQKVESQTTERTGTRLRSAVLFLTAGVVLLAAAALIFLDAVEPGCDVMISSTSSTITVSGTAGDERVYCFEQSIDATTKALDIQADHIVIDGKKDLGRQITGAKAGIEIRSRQYVTIRNIKTTGSLSIYKGHHNQILNSEAVYMGIDDSADNTIDGNIITSSSNRAMQIGDISETGSRGTTRNVISHNTIQNNTTEAPADRIIDRFIVVKRTQHTQFVDNNVILRGVRSVPGDNPSMMVMYETYNSLIARNTLSIQADPTVIPGGASYYGGGLLLRDNSSFNIIEGNTIDSNVKRGLWMQSGTAGIPDPVDNVIRYNRIYDTYNALNIHAIPSNTTGTVIKGNLLHVKQGFALGLSGVRTGSSVLVEGNTIIAENGTAVIDDENDPDRTAVLRNNIIRSTNAEPIQINSLNLVSESNTIYRFQPVTPQTIEQDPAFTKCSVNYPDGDVAGEVEDPVDGYPDGLAKDEPWVELGDVNDPLDGTDDTDVEDGTGNFCLPSPTNVFGALPSGRQACQPIWTNPTWATCDDGRQSRSVSESGTTCNRDVGRPLTVQMCTSGTDRTPSTAHISYPSSGQGVSGSVNINDTSFDTYGVVGVQFKVDGQNIGAEDMTYNYKISWNTTTVTNGTHVLTAVARDAAGFTTTSNSVTVNVQNIVSPGVPSPAYSIIGSQTGTLYKPVILGTTTYATTIDPPVWPKFVIEVKDNAGTSLPNKTVSIDFSNAAIKLWNYQRSGVAVNCSTKKLTVQTDSLGRASFVPQFGKYNNTSTAVDVSVDGISLGKVAAASSDLDGANATNPVDLSRFLAVSFSTCTNSSTCSSFNTVSAQADYNRDGLVNAVDLSLFNAAKFVSDTKANYCP